MESQRSQLQQLSICWRCFATATATIAAATIFETEHFDADGIARRIDNETTGVGRGGMAAMTSPAGTAVTMTIAGPRAENGIGAADGASGRHGRRRD